jgi:hypothetical protein
MYEALIQQGYACCQSSNLEAILEAYFRLNLMLSSLLPELYFRNGRRLSEAARITPEANATTRWPYSG